ncbi:hypothetical protein RYB20_21750, partial [Pseudomonas syringae pv. actinidifoliorum]|nr:hypothetical protein [Pseudomonas syringae pv. actinidifoliorum]
KRCYRGTARQRCLSKQDPHFLLGGVCGADTMQTYIAAMQRFSVKRNHQPKETTSALVTVILFN